MARKTIPTSPIDIDVVYKTLCLDGSELLDSVTLLLHQHFGSHCTCIVEINRFRSNAKTLSFACENQLQSPAEYELSGTPCSTVSQSQLDYVLYKGGLSDTFPEDTNLKQAGVESYLGIPLRSASGNVLGVLLSSFTSQLSDSEDLIYYHKLFAKVVVHSLRSKWLSAQSESLVEQLSFEVSHDNLTGLLNRSFLADKLETLTELSKQPFTLVYIDIDNFKSINDLYGSYIGDQIIKFVARSIEECIEDRQLAFRIAGDEFAFISLSGDPFEICRQIIEKVSSGYQDPARNIKVSISIGLARNNSNSLTADQIILNASLALKECKQSRQTSIQCYDTHLSAQYYRRAIVIDALRSELDKDIEQSEIYVVAQPIVAQGKAQWDYFEILARWNSDVLGAISPLEFIEAAEQSGLIIELGERIIELACQAKIKLEQGLGYRVRLGINCSAHEINNANRYVQHLLHTLGKYGFNAEDFTIEMTETVLLSRINEVKTTLDKLRLLGFSIALDDFGTGYSSLNYIHTYPIDCIKIDATFIRNMLSNESSESVVWLIIQLANQLHVSLIAEGVENEEALQKLYSMGCKKIQGFYFSTPKVPEELVETIKALTNIESQVSNG
ncbi:putative bifunctional diguanylate cyclase/phosphodiesterase [Vibrio hepatarius]|uniref:putative bifunctional diguanylate cyclase/phosphodiesterase n=1 Tax=Vibrio hepatarius TaxID=171383 RepID=UPI00148D0AE7|nr:bifunctional diguanylate cyclase/phosphodiesterase [Vibrio hepatarius]NOI13894.1 EAL domain-containing protein [Vibrio hepatarius]